MLRSVQLNVGIGFLNDLFFWPEQYRRTSGMSIVFLFDENPDIASVGLRAQRSEGREVFRDRGLARTQSERDRRLALTTGFGSQTVWNRSTRRAGAGRPMAFCAMRVLWDFGMTNMPAK
jgi:hypothetical protein